MGIVRDTNSNLVGGISQQPDKIMYPSQAKQLDNYLLSLSEGLKKRPPTEYIARLMHTQTVQPLYQSIIKETEKYIVCLTGETIKVFDLDGTERFVKINNSDLPYITSNNPLRELEVTNIGDYTFVLNKTITTQLSSEKSANPYNASAIIFVKQADFGVKYTITLNGKEYAYAVPVSTSTENNTSVKRGDYTYSSGSGSSNNDKARTTTIASNLKNLLLSLGANWQLTLLGSTILVQNTAGIPFTITATDSNGNNNLFAYYNTADSVQQLPTIAPNGFILKIVGEQTDEADDYYVKFETSDGSTFGKGTWKECCCPNIEYKLDETTMPHALIRQADNTFSFETIDWTERQAGDEVSAPSPSFINNTIEEVFTHKGRLGFLSADKTILSDTEDIFSFFKSTVRTELDTDPIDIMSNAKMVDLIHSLPYNQELMVFSPTAQFVVKGGDIFSNNTVTVDLALNYPCSSKCKPINIGHTGLFVFENGEHSRVREIYLTSTYSMDARDITEQCPTYLPKNIYKLSGSEANNIVCILSTETPNKIFIYNYYYSSEQKNQSAWCEWTFDVDKVLNVDWDDNYLYIITQTNNNGIYLERMNLSPKIKEPELDYLFYLDRKKYLDSTQLTYDVQTDTTTFTVPFKTDDNFIVLNNKGFPLDFTAESDEQPEPEPTAPPEPTPTPTPTPTPSPTPEPDTTTTVFLHIIGGGSLKSFRIGDLILSDVSEDIYIYIPKNTSLTWEAVAAVGYEIEAPASGTINTSVPINLTIKVYQPTARLQVIFIDEGGIPRVSSFEINGEIVYPFYEQKSSYIFELPLDTLVQWTATPVAGYTISPTSTGSISLSSYDELVLTITEEQP